VMLVSRDGIVDSSTDKREAILRVLPLVCSNNTQAEMTHSQWHRDDGQPYSNC
jgi:hypothetical protein